MSTQQILIRLPEEVAAKFKAVVPARQRNRFVAELVANAVARHEDELAKIATAVTNEEKRSPKIAEEMHDWDSTIGDGIEESVARMRSLKRGDVVWVNLDPTVGGEIHKRRPCVVVSLSVLNDKRLTVVVVPLSTGSTPRPPLVVSVPSAGARSNARIDQIRAVDKSRIIDATEKLNRADMEQVEQGLRTVLGL